MTELTEPWKNLGLKIVDYSFMLIVDYLAQIVDYDDLIVDYLSQIVDYSDLIVHHFDAGLK